MMVSITLYLHEDRLRQLLSIDDFDRYLLTRNAVDPKLDESWQTGMKGNKKDMRQVSIWGGKCTLEQWIGFKSQKQVCCTCLFDPFPKFFPVDRAQHIELTDLETVPYSYCSDWRLTTHYYYCCTTVIAMNVILDSLYRNECDPRCDLWTSNKIHKSNWCWFTTSGC